MSSPSVVFTDEQALMGDKATLYSSTSDEQAGSITSIKDEIIDSSQPESQVRGVTGTKSMQSSLGLCTLAKI